MQLESQRRYMSIKWKHPNFLNWLRFSQSFLRLLCFNLICVVIVITSTTLTTTATTTTTTFIMSTIIATTTRLPCGGSWSTMWWLLIYHGVVPDLPFDLPCGFWSTMWWVVFDLPFRSLCSFNHFLEVFDAVVFDLPLRSFDLPCGGSWSTVWCFFFLTKKSANRLSQKPDL